MTTRFVYFIIAQLYNSWDTSGVKEVYYKYYHKIVKQTYYFKFVYHEKQAREIFQWCGEGQWVKSTGSVNWYLMMVGHKKFKKISYRNLVIAIL